MRILFTFINLVLLTLTLYPIPYTLYPIKASAAPLSLSVSPPILEIITRPGEEIRTPLKITNNTEESAQLEIEFFPFSPRNSPNNQGEVEFLNIELPIKNIISLEEKDLPTGEITLRPKETRVLTLHLSLPKDQEPNDHYFSIVFLSKSPSEQPKTRFNLEREARSAIRGGIAINVLLAIEAKDEEQAEVKISEFESAKFLQNGPVSFRVRVDNEGKHFAKVGGKILITNMFGQKIGLLTLSAQNILAGDTRIYAPITFPEKLILGPYLAELKIEGTKVKTAKTIFFAFPLSQFLWGILILVFLLVIQKRVRSRFDR